MIDYHLHLWPHGSRDHPPSVEELQRFCDVASSRGVAEIAITEHLFRFSQADSLLRGFWSGAEDERLRASMETYWESHAAADLDRYVDVVQAAKSAGLPVVLGLEVDYYRGRMGEVAELLSGYPFDVLLGSVHWIGAWRFDDLDDEISMEMWNSASIERTWDLYTEAL